MKRFNYVVLRSPSKNVSGFGESNDVSISDLFKSHEILVNFFKNIGIKVHALPALKDEYNYIKLDELCITTRKCLIFANLENNIINNYKTELASHMSRFYPLDRIHYINFPATISGKDILVVNDTYYVSLSDKTNVEGAEKLKEILTKYDFRVIIVPNSNGHLKDNLNYLDYNNMLIKEGYMLPDEFREFNLIPVNLSEENGIGTLWINDTIIIPNNCEELKQNINSLNKYVVVNINDAEFRKLDALLTNMVVLF